MSSPSEQARKITNIIDEQRMKLMELILGGSTPQLDCGADRKSVASQRCRDTGGQPFESAPITLTDAEWEAVEQAAGRAHQDALHGAAATLRGLLERLGGER